MEGDPKGNAVNRQGRGGPPRGLRGLRMGGATGPTVGSMGVIAGA